MAECQGRAASQSCHRSHANVFWEASEWLVEYSVVTIVIVLLQYMYADLEDHVASLGAASTLLT